MKMERKKKVEPKGRWIIKWSTTSSDGFRVKHRLWREQREGFEDCIYHVEIRLTDDPVTLSQGIHCTFEVFPRQFFGKVWIAQRIECKKASTWKAIGEAVRQLEMKER